MPLHSQTSDTVLKRLTSLFRALPSASLPDLQASHASPMPNSDPRDHGDGDNDEGQQDQEQEEGQQKRASEQLSGESRSSNSKPSDEAEQPSSELRSSKPSDEAESRQSNLETLDKPSSNELVVVADQSADLQAGSTAGMDGKAESKVISSIDNLTQEPIGPSDKEIIAREAVREAQNQKENQLHVSVCSPPLSERSPSAVTQSLLSVPSSTVPKQRLSSLKVDNVHVLEADRKNSGGKTSSAFSVARTPASDGYNWRKYGQKQVKSPTGSRSYYRCTHSDCCAKKVECCDHSGHVIEIVYKSQHSHEPPRKINSAGESKIMSSNGSTVETSVPEHPIRMLNDADPSHSSKEPLHEVPCSADRKRQKSSRHGENGKVISKEEHVDEPELKRRVKKGDLADLDSHMKPGKKSKLVVHAAGAVGVSGDGYRWRKYGQKMVKGNPHPRNYYRCTSAGCPVRKQIETAVDNSDAVIITYKGVHDHDKPVPKKRQGPPSASLMAAVAPTSSKNLHLKNTDSLQNQKSSTQFSVDTEGELTGEASDLGGEKAIESARTLLSIGIEIKPC